MRPSSAELVARPARPEKARRNKGYSMAEVETFYGAISGWESPKLGGMKTDVQAVRDLVVLHAKTGMHRSEIERIARGECQMEVLNNHPEIRGVVRFIHKSGRVHTQSLDGQTLAAAQRLQVRGGAPADSWVRKVLRHTAKNLGREPLKLGQMRHPFVSWALEHGVEVRPVEGGVPPIHRRIHRGARQHEHYVTVLQREDRQAADPHPAAAASPRGPDSSTRPADSQSR